MGVGRSYLSINMLPPMLKERNNMTQPVKIIFGLCLFIAHTSFGQINNPSYSSREVTYCDIVKIERTLYNTTVYFKYTAPSKYENGGWVCASGEFFIRDTYSKLIYKLIKANNIPICPTHHNFQFIGQSLEFNFVFEALPNTTSKIDIIEDEINGGFNFFGVILSTSNNTTGEIKILKNEAKMRESTNPLSNTLYTLPAGTQVKILGLDGGYYNVEYNWKIGYINELFFENSKKSNVTPSNSSTSSSYTSPKKWNEKTLKDYWIKNKIDEIEGIYELVAVNNSASKYTLALKKTFSDKYELIYLSGAYKDYNGKWNTGDTKAILTNTATKNLFKVKWFLGDKSITENVYINFETGFMNVIWTENPKDLYLKLYPTSEDQNSIGSKSPSSGTGFAISSNGYIVTNHHVTNGAASIKIRGVNGDFIKTYSAIVIIEDRNNDLSIIKIDDPNFTSLGTIPYKIANHAIDVGSSVFVLGYPLRATMGDEVKLTNGIVSSKSGYQGDVTSYQITAPVQPGNSGGPLFDDNGSIVGIINAKHIGAENASYAVKASYLMNLIDLIPSPPTLQTISTVVGKPLIEQVKILKKFTYIIEIN